MSELNQGKKTFIIFINLLTNSICPEAQLSVYQREISSVDTKPTHDKTVKKLIKQLKSTSTKGLIIDNNTKNFSLSLSYWTPCSPSLLIIG